MALFLSEILKSLLLAVHLLALGLAAAGPLFCMLLARGSHSECATDRVGRHLAWLNVGGFLVGMFLGGLTLLLPPDQGYWDVLNKIPAKDYWFAAAELLFSLLCLIGYAATWNVLRDYRLWHALIALLTVTNLLYHFPPLMIVIGQLADGSALLPGDALDRAALTGLMFRTQVVAPWIHFVLATLTIAGGTALLLLAHQQKDKSDVVAVRPIRLVAGATLVVALLQLPIGLWLVTTISQASRAAIMGNSAIASLTFLAAMCIAFLLLGRLFKIALGEFETEDLRKAALWIVLVVLAMAVSMRTSRYRGPERQVELSKQKGHGESIAVAQ